MSEEPEVEPEDDGSARSGSRRRGGVARTTTKIVLGLLSVVALGAMAVLWARVGQFQDRVNTTDAVAEAQERSKAPPPAADGAEDYLIVGSDSRTDLQGNPLPAHLLDELRTHATDTANTDTLIVLRIPRDGGRGYAVSIPRDTYIPLPDHRPEKINAVFGLTKAEVASELASKGELDSAAIERKSDDAGRAALVQAVQHLTGVRIDHYAEISMYGFYLLTEAIDGVEVCLKQATSDPDSGADFAAGRQVVRGGDAVAFVRQRKNLPRGDLDRIVRQQTFLASAMDKVLSSDVLTNNAKLSALEEAVGKTVVMDSGMHFLDLLDKARSLAAGRVEFVTIPVVNPAARDDRGLSIVKVNIPAVRRFVTGLISDDPPAKPRDKLHGKPLLDLNGVGRTAVPCVY